MINENRLTDALVTIKTFCDERNHVCKDCPLSNFNDECLIYEYPHLWNVKTKKVVKVLLDNGK